jgi:hypothetical protein
MNTHRTPWEGAVTSLFFDVSDGTGGGTSGKLFKALNIVIN